MEEPKTFENGKPVKAKRVRQYKKEKPGQPTKLTEEITEDLCNLLRMGNFFSTALVLSGIPTSTFHNWIKWGKERPESEYGKFLEAVERAIEEATVRDLQVVDNAIMGKATIYERYPQGTLIPAKDHKGNPALYPHNHPTKACEPIMIDVSGQVVMDEKGKPVIQEIGLIPDANLALRRLAIRKPKEWGRGAEVFPEQKQALTADQQRMEDEARRKRLAQYEELKRLENGS